MVLGVAAIFRAAITSSTRQSPHLPRIIERHDAIIDEIQPRWWASCDHQSLGEAATLARVSMAKVCWSACPADPLMLPT